MLVALQALKSVFPVEDFFSNKEIHTFSRIRGSAHISTQVKHLNQGCATCGHTVADNEVCGRPHVI